MIYLLAAEAAQPTSWVGVVGLIVAALVAAGVPAALARLLNAKSRQLEAVIEGVEAIEDDDARAKAKASIKRTTMERQVGRDVHEAVEKKTRRL